MTETNENISALIDDEVDKSTIDKLLIDEEMQNVWNRYHLIGDCLRDSLPEKIDTALANSVKQQIQQEPTILAPSKNKAAVMKPALGFAIAASVALVAVLGIKQTNQTDLNISTGNIVAKQESSNINTMPVSQTYEFNQAPQYRQAAVQTDTPANIVNDRMSGQLINHNEYRKGGGMTAIRPYVRIVTIQAEE